MPAFAQTQAKPAAATPSIRVGEPDPTAPHLPMHPGSQTRPAADPAGEAFKAWDKDHNGSLSPMEFRAGWQQVQRITETQARLRQQFGVVDANKNNAIDPAEYGSLLLIKNAGKTAPQMAAFDANHDGKLGFAEYVTLVQTLAPQEAGKGAK